MAVLGVGQMGLVCAGLLVGPDTFSGATPGLAAATGAGSWLLAHPFLTSHTPKVVLPVLGEMQLPSAFLFDVGVAAVVFGASGLILIALAHQSLRK